MILYGHVRDRLPRIQLSVQGQDTEHSIEFILDSGFDGELVLNQSIVNSLGVRRLAPRRVHLADGAEIDCLAGQLMLHWDDEPRKVEVLVMNGNPLIGMRLLNDCQVCFHVSDGGEVTIEEG